MTAASGRLTPAHLFNGYVGTNVAFALDQCGVLDHLVHAGGATVEQLAAAGGVDSARLRSVVEAAIRLGLMEDRDDRLLLTAAGADLAHEIGYFVWAVGGYGELFGRLAEWTRGTMEFGTAIRRDPVMVAQGSAKVDASVMTATLFEILDDVEFRVMADLGCGNAARLMAVCTRYPEASGVGVEISEEACRVARRRIEEAGLEKRITVHCADVTRFDGAPEERERVDLVTSFLLMHDLLAASDPPEALFAGLRRTFPNARRYLVGDTNRMPSETREPPIFAVGFELAHRVMSIPIRSREEYEEIFRRAGLELRRCEPFGAPNTWLYLLESR
jgi:hypothetical protein